MPISFEVYPTRQVPPEPAVARWTVQVQRGGSWEGWRWLDWLDKWNWVGPPFILLLMFEVMTLPSIAYRRLQYLFARREDWEVLVWEGDQRLSRPRHALVREVHTTKAAAIKRAEAIYLLLGSGLRPAEWPDGQK